MPASVGCADAPRRNANNAAVRNGNANNGIDAMHAMALLPINRDNHGL